MIEYEDKELQLTDDGSATIYLPGLDEHYHSVKGALSESEHIYRDCGFLHRAGINGANSARLRLLEVGFGTGLNAAVTAMVADAGCQVHYISLEKYPITDELAATLGYESIVDAEVFAALHRAPWNEAVGITQWFTIEKRLCDFTEDALPEGIDVVYLDSFAPEKQPEMWTMEALARVVEVMNEGGVLTTYCAKGEIRRRLQSLGLIVERLRGPLNGKREILRATKR